MNTLIMKLGATGDVVRTTPLLSRLAGHVAWVTASKNVVLLKGLRESLTCVSWEERHLLPDVKYDLVINLEDTLDVAEFLKSIPYRQLFGAYADDKNVLRYTDDSKRWFDLSLISTHGRAEADRLKFLNRRTYQDLIFEGLGFSFKADKYLRPAETQTSLSGDIAISPEAGPVWPMKNWSYYPELRRQLEDRGLVVNLLPTRKTLLEHLADVRNHRCLVAGDSLPMHFALGSGVRCVTLFTCTSPWAIYDYGIQTKIVSPLLSEFFYKRGVDGRATTAISVDEVLSAALAQVTACVPKAGKALA
jgi:ADP-heptose:LPS heptosyltransferase